MGKEAEHHQTGRKPRFWGLVQDIPNWRGLPRTTVLRRLPMCVSIEVPFLGQVSVTGSLSSQKQEKAEPRLLFAVLPAGSGETFSWIQAGWFLPTFEVPASCRKQKRHPLVLKQGPTTPGFNFTTNKDAFVEARKGVFFFFLLGTGLIAVPVPT